MTLPSFELVRPSTIVGVAEALDRFPGTRCISGGTDLLVSMRQGLAAPPQLVDVTGVPEMQRLEERDGVLFVGAAVTLRRLHDFLVEHGSLGAAREAVEVVASPVLRNMGTVGGNICLDPRCVYYNRSREWRERQGFCLRHQGSICQAAPKSSVCFAVFSADVPLALVALGAEVDICGIDHGALTVRREPLERLYTGDGARHLALQAGEFVGGVRVPLMVEVEDTTAGADTTTGAGSMARLASAYEKCRWRKAIDFPTAGVAVALELTEGVITRARVVVGGLSPAPLVAVQTAERLAGERPSLGVFTSAADVLGRGSRTVNNHAAGAAYRKSVSRALFVRLCERLCSPLEVDA
jgi:4-hydroxybenzoyl-CoA reductase subunit beta